MTLITVLIQTCYSNLSGAYFHGISGVGGAGWAVGSGSLFKSCVGPAPVCL